MEQKAKRTNRIHIYRWTPEPAVSGHANWTCFRSETAFWQHSRALGFSWTPNCG